MGKKRPLLILDLGDVAWRSWFFFPPFSFSSRSFPPQTPKQHLLPLTLSHHVDWPLCLALTQQDSCCAAAQGDSHAVTHPSPSRPFISLSKVHKNVYLTTGLQRGLLAYQDLSFLIRGFSHCLLEKLSNVAQINIDGHVNIGMQKYTLR